MFFGIWPSYVYMNPAFSSNPDCFYSKLFLTPSKHGRSKCRSILDTRSSSEAFTAARASFASQPALLYEQHAFSSNVSFQLPNPFPHLHLHPTIPIPVYPPNISPPNQNKPWGLKIWLTDTSRFLSGLIRWNSHLEVSNPSPEKLL